jgi:hypothetical protein
MVFAFHGGVCRLLRGSCHLNVCKAKCPMCAMANCIHLYLTDWSLEISTQFLQYGVLESGCVGRWRHGIPAPDWPPAFRRSQESTSTEHGQSAFHPLRLVVNFRYERLRHAWDIQIWQSIKKAEVPHLPSEISDDGRDFVFKCLTRCVFELAPAYDVPHVDFQMCYRANDVSALFV